jgi:hypothetical protein
MEYQKSPAANTNNCHPRESGDPALSNASIQQLPGPPHCPGEVIDARADRPVPRISVNVQYHRCFCNFLSMVVFLFSRGFASAQSASGFWRNELTIQIISE